MDTLTDEELLAPVDTHTHPTHIPDDPASWRVPRQALQYDHLIDWWEYLHETDCAIHATFGDHADEVLMLATELTHLFMKADYSTVEAPRLRLKRCSQILRTLYSFGLDSRQIADLLDLSVMTVVELAASGSRRTQIDPPALWEAELLLRGQQTSGVEIARRTGLSIGQVETLSKRISVSLPRPARYAPPDVIAEALRLRAERTMTVPQIVAHLKDTRDDADALTVAAVYKAGNRQDRAS